MKRHPEDYEQILSNLDDQIDAAETRLIDLDRKLKRWQVIFLLHTTVLWALYLIYSLFATQRNGLESIIFMSLPTVASPGLIYYGREIMRWFFRREQGKHYAKLARLWALRALRIKELESISPNHPLVQQQSSAVQPGEYPLICKHCYAYNGIVQDPEDLQFVCPKCFEFNPRSLNGTPVASQKEEDSIASRVKRNRRMPTEARALIA